MVQRPIRPVTHPAGQLAAALDEALGLLKDFPYAREPAVAGSQTPASLLDQCLALCAQQDSKKPEPVRTIHHFACTGGTLISKCIAAMPNTQVLSEVDPLSTLGQCAQRPRFAPTDTITLMRQSTRGVDSALILELFLSNLELVYSDSVASGLRLVLRDHTHSHFCTGDKVPKRPTFRSIVASKFPTLSLVTVRHPLDSFLSLKKNGWVHFNPTSFDEYCARYLSFFMVYDDVPFLRYEEFVASPAKVMEVVCDHLEIPFSDQFVDLFSVFNLTGDSGRGGGGIELRPRREIEPGLAQEIEASTNYRELLHLLNYDD